MTGWGQDDPWLRSPATTSTTYAIAGALHEIRPDDGAPVPPMNLVGDYGGGGMFLVAGVLSALLAVANGAGAAGRWSTPPWWTAPRSSSAACSASSGPGCGHTRRVRTCSPVAAPYYGVYTTADDRYLAVGAIEPQFWAAFLQTLELDDDPADRRPAAIVRCGPAARRRVAEVIAGRTLDDWMVRFDGVDACVAPVVAPWDSPQHPHLAARGAYDVLDGVVQPAPAPRFSVTPRGADHERSARRSAHLIGTGRLGCRRRPDRRAARHVGDQRASCTILVGTQRRGAS